MPINYEKQTYVNGSGATPLSAGRLNHNENGTKAAADAVDALPGIIASNYVGVIRYINGAYAPRPIGAASITWIGPTEPPQMLDDVDLWTEVTA